MSAPRAKRPFAGAASDPAQRQITSFFPAAGTTLILSSEDSVPSRPVLPADTQSNLLNVGMRVRKSVPEGYKTGSYNAFSLFDDRKTTQPPVVSTAVVRTNSSSYTSQRELLPFCGINKVGGLSSQPSFSFSTTPPPLPPHIFRADEDVIPGIDDVPSLSSSQDSVSSNMSSSTPLSINTNLTPNQNRKRVYNEGEESDAPSVSDCLQVPSGEWMDGQVSPRSLVPVGWENTRVMAVPRKIRRSLVNMVAAPTVTIASEKACGHMGQENMVVDDDFPEADFLDRRALQGDAMDL